MMSSSWRLAVALCLGPACASFGDGSTGQERPDGGGAADASGNPGEDAAVVGLISIEAEDYEANTTRQTYPWVVDTTAGSSGAEAMLAQGPGIDAIMYPTYYTQSSQLDYQVVFDEAGTYYVWMRGIGAGSADTCIPGLDGTGWATAENTAGALGIPKNAPMWEWGGTDHLTAERITIEVPDAATHTFTIWLREDGIILDKIVLTTDADFVPVEMGPPANQ